MISIKSAAAISIDGSPAGSVADCIANYPELAEEIQAAFSAWEAANAPENNTP